MSTDSPSAGPVGNRTAGDAPSAADQAQAFADALRCPDTRCPPGLTSWNGSDPAQRLAVYRNNVRVSLIDALAAGHPVVQALVGRSFFRAMAAGFVQAHPPRSAVLLDYGEGFDSFIAAFPPASALPYLADVARLEWLRVCAWHAADAVALPTARLAALLTDAGRLPRLRLILHPALHCLSSAHPVVTLWRAHQQADPAAAVRSIDLSCGETALLLRSGTSVEIMAIPAEAGTFLRRLQAGHALGEAAAVPALDLPGILALLIREGALTGVIDPLSAGAPVTD